MIDLADMNARVQWTAAVWDTWGSVGFIRGPTTATAVAQLSTTNEDVVRLVYETIVASGIGVEKYAIIHKNMPNRTAFLLRIARLGALRSLATLMEPHAFTKARQWALVAEFVSSRLRGSGEMGADGRTRRRAPRRPYSPREMEIVADVQAMTAVKGRRSRYPPMEGS